MGSITPEGTADIFCYEHGNEIINPNLGAHLGHFGINILQQEKTQKSIAELVT
jgi:ubiquitin carboxyl-terminal hydrolase 5/13